MRAALIGLVAFVLGGGILLVPYDAEAQTCRTGKPCGNTCIARNLTCRVDPGSARSATGARAPAPSRAVAADVPPGTQFVAASRGRVYYWIGCSAWRSLSQSNLRFFVSRAEAQDVGYSVSTQDDCVGPVSGGAQSVAPIRRVNAPPGVRVPDTAGFVSSDGVEVYYPVACPAWDDLDVDRLNWYLDESVARSYEKVAAFDKCPQ